MILLIETSADYCSVGISTGPGEVELSEAEKGYTHAEQLSPRIEELLGSKGIDYKDLKAIAISAGPGSYTGLRIGTSTAKGLCYALNIPLVSISTFAALGSHSQLAQYRQGGNQLVPMIDARRMEVYTTTLNTKLTEVVEPSNLILDEEVVGAWNGESTVFFGSGAPKLRELEAGRNLKVIEDINPSARLMVDLAWEKYDKQDFEDVAYYEPFYLKDFHATTPKKLL